MTNQTHQQTQPLHAVHLPQPDTLVAQPFPPLNAVNSPAVDTAAAAYYLNRRPQTLRTWACFESGPLRPMRINGRLAWRVTDIKTVMGV